MLDVNHGILGNARYYTNALHTSNAFFCTSHAVKKKNLFFSKNVKGEMATVHALESVTQYVTQN